MTRFFASHKRRPRNAKPQLDSLECIIAPSGLTPFNHDPAIKVDVSFKSHTDVTQNVTQKQISNPHVSVSQTADASGNASGGTAMGGNNTATSGDVKAKIDAQSGNATAKGANAYANTDAQGGTAKNDSDLTVNSYFGDQSVSQDVSTSQELNV